MTRTRTPQPKPDQTHQVVYALGQTTGLSEFTAHRVTSEYVLAHEIADRYTENDQPMQALAIIVPGSAHEYVMSLNGAAIRYRLLADAGFVTDQDGHKVTARHATILEVF